MNTKQQREAREYFSRSAREWEQRAERTSPARVNVIRQRNQYVLAALTAIPRVHQALDVGCGTGELVIAFARRGIAATGIDFSEAMIRRARRKAGSMRKATFVCASVFDYDLGSNAGKFDLVVANGFIEYISLRELGRFLTFARRALRRGGTLILSSRNRLFNIWSLNRFTENELAGGGAEAIIRESIAIANATRIADLAAVQPAAPPKEATFQPKTNRISVSQRYQYTPVQLIRILGRHGFRASDIAPVHIHGVSPAFKDRYPRVHVRISNLLQRYAGAHPALIPFASSFMIRANVAPPRRR